MLKSFFNKIFEEALLVIVSALVLILSFTVKIPDVSKIDYGVIAFLSILMLISLGLEKEGFLDKIAVTVIDKSHSEKKIAITMLFTTALIAMFVTNDVALITVVPITLIIARKGSFDPFRIIILETVAANFGGSLSPMGNPQNIFLYHYYDLQLLEFLYKMAPFFILSSIIAMLVILSLNKSKIEFEDEKVEIKSKKNIIIYLMLLMVAILTVLRLVDTSVTFGITVLAVIFVDRKLFKNLDCFLLITFVMFFIIIDQISSIDLVRNLAAEFSGSPLKTMITASILSQAISNVPSAILTAPFSKDGYALVLGVSIGGFGTMIASLANLISYKFYINQYQNSLNRRNYLIYFHKINFLFFVVLIFAFSLILIKCKFYIS